MENVNNIFNSLDKILSNTNLEDVTSESTGFPALPDGYYLCEVEKSELKESKSSHQPMAVFQFKVVENGICVNVDDKGEVHLKELNKTKDKKLFVNYVLKDENGVRRFVTDMLKFEGDNGESLLPKEAFTTSETLEEAIGALIGMRVYVQVSTTINDDDSSSTWNNLISWKRAKKLDLPV